MSENGVAHNERLVGPYVQVLKAEERNWDEEERHQGQCSRRGEKYWPDRQAPRAAGKVV